MRVEDTRFIKECCLTYVRSFQSPDTLLITLSFDRIYIERGLQLKWSF